MGKLLLFTKQLLESNQLILFFLPVSRKLINAKYSPQCTMLLKMEDSGVHSVSPLMFGISNMKNVKNVQKFIQTVLANVILTVALNVKKTMYLEMMVIVMKHTMTVKNMTGMKIMEFTALNVMMVFSSLLMHLMKTKMNLNQDVLIVMMKLGESSIVKNAQM